MACHSVLAYTHPRIRAIWMDTGVQNWSTWLGNPRVHTPLWMFSGFSVVRRPCLARIRCTQRSDTPMPFHNRNFLSTPLIILSTHDRTSTIPTSHMANQPQFGPRHALPNFLVAVEG